MHRRLYQYLSLIFASVLASSVSQSNCAAEHTQRSTSYVKITFKVSISAEGLPGKIEFVSIEPLVAPREQADLVKAARQAMSTWTFNPKVVHGQPVAADVDVPVILDLAWNVPVIGN